MRRRTVGGLVLGGWLAVASAAVAGSPTYLQQVDQRGHAAFHRWNGGPAPRAVSRAEARAKPTDADKLRVSADGAAARRSEEEHNLMRRLAVCDRLKELALETGDTRLEEQAAALEKQAGSVYRMRTSELPVRRRLGDPAERGDQK